MLHPDRLFPTDPATRAVARELFKTVEGKPILSPHGHTDPIWWGENPAFSDPSSLFIIPDHYVVRMLISQGISYESLGIGEHAEQDKRRIWQTFAKHYHLFQGTPSRMWLDHAFETVFGIESRLSPSNADDLYDVIAHALSQPDYRPQSLFERFNIELIATTDSPLDDLRHHQQVQDGDWSGRVIPTYRPDDVIDADQPTFHDNIQRLGALTGCDIGQWQGYLDAHRLRRQVFIRMGATATDHGHPTAQTADLTTADASKLYQRILQRQSSRDDHELFRAQMLTEMARMSIDDGLVMQLHAGCWRNYSHTVEQHYGANRGFDIPVRSSFVEGLHPLLNALGMDNRLSLILFTLDESTYARELAPLAGAFPALRLGPSWWFHDSFEGMRRYRQMITESAGLYNTVGFNDDTRALCSIPARHDVARRCDCAFLAELVTSHRLDEDEAYTLAPLLATELARKAYKL